MTKEKEILDAMKDLCSSDEGSLGAAEAAINRSIAEINQQVRQRIRQIGDDIRANARAARRRFYWGIGARYALRPDTPPARYGRAPLATTDGIRKGIEDIERMRREFDAYRIEPLDPSVYKTLADVTRLTDELRNRRMAACKDREDKNE